MTKSRTDPFSAFEKQHVVMQIVFKTELTIPFLVLGETRQWTAFMIVLIWIALAVLFETKCTPARFTLKEFQVLNVWTALNSTIFVLVVTLQKNLGQSIWHMLSFWSEACAILALIYITLLGVRLFGVLLAWLFSRRGKCSCGMEEQDSL